MTDLSHLFDRNVAWADAKTAHDPDFFRRMAEQQTPNYLWIGCSDSRVTANDVLGLDPGEIFVHRNIANIVHSSDMNILAVLEFAVEVLRVQHVIVAGHYGCGGVRRAMAEERGALVDHWLQPLSMFYRKHRAVFDAIDDAGRQIDRLCEINVEMQIRRLAATPIVEAAWARGAALALHGWIYGMHDGLLRDLGTSVASLEARDALPSIDARVGARQEPLSARRRQALEAFAAIELADMASPPCCMPPIGRETR
jgi:carbonic anhydrase